MPSVNMQPDGWGELAKNIDKFADAGLAPVVRVGLADAANAIRQEVERSAPKTIRKVLGRWPVKVVSDRLHAVPEWVIVVVTNPLAHLLEHGTGIHGPFKQRIVPGGRTSRLRRAVRVRGGGSDRPPVMRFFKGGQAIFRQSVAGMRAKPFFGPALRNVQPKVRGILVDMVQGLGRRWNRM